jgi:5S rRNA maturation endonuclease (ribonuclease M5)
MPFDWEQAAKPAPDADEVRSLASIVDVVGSRVPLRRKGRELVALCPFHEDSTPSMAVITHKGRGFYKCHACGSGGDAIRFVMHFDGVDFAEAVRRIAEGIALPSVPMKRPSKAPKIEEHRYREDCGEVIDAWRGDTTADCTARAAEVLGVSPISLERLEFARGPRGEFAWPMRDERLWQCGIRLREPVDDGAAKWALTGSRAGVFIEQRPNGFRGVKRVFVVEGPTDAAALMSVLDGVEDLVIGRASCTGQHDMVLRILRLIRPEPEVCIILDQDGPGVAGGTAIADDYVTEIARVRVMRPPSQFKDIRKWMRGMERQTARGLFELRLSTRLYHRRGSIK